MTAAPSATAFPITRSATPVPAAERAARMENPIFGKVFSDHMGYAVWREGEGWGEHQIAPVANLPLHPGAAALHYGQQVFEGLKAYRWADGSVALFRPDANAARMARSAERMALPAFPEADFLAALDALVALDEPWVPSAPGTSLYLRPALFGSEPSLLVVPPLEVTYTLTACTVGAYLAPSKQGASIWVTRDYHRATEGGTGEAKTGGNYAGGMRATQQAHEHGCSQVLFLDAKHGRFVEEFGAMNFMAVRRDGSIVTPRLSGTILPGITRDSLLTLFRDEGREVEEKDIAIDELIADVRTGEITEIFACGTAAIITAVGQLKSDDFDVTVGTGEPGPVTVAALTRLTDIQYGRAEDPHGWIRKVV